MKYASDFRTIARDSLRGRWGIAVIAGLIASLLGAIASSGPEIKFNFSDNGNDYYFQFSCKFHLILSSHVWQVIFYLFYLLTFLLFYS